MKVWTQICFSVSLALLLQGCTTPETRVMDDQVVVPGLPFIRDGKITRGEIFDRLGQPASRFEESTIVIYWLREGEHGYLEVVPKNAAAISLQEHYALDFLGHTNRPGKPPRKPVTGYYNLVLVFDDNEILAEHSLVFIR